MFQKTLRWLLFVLVILFAVSVCFILIVSPGKTNGPAIAMIEKPLINGMPQGLIIRGTDTANPVLLFVHGGPGMPAFPFLTDEFKNGMEKMFTVCYWEQRGSALSYAGNIPPSSMTLEQLINDGAAVTGYLQQQFGKKKIYLLGHSWGTWLASCMAGRYPELYFAYLGIGQLGNPYQSEIASRRFVLDEAAKRKEDKVIRAMEQLPVPSMTADAATWQKYLEVQRPYVFAYGGARYGKKRTMTDLAKEIILCHEYSPRDKWNYRKGLYFSQQALWSSMIRSNLAQQVPAQSIPVYIFQGLHDHQTDFALAREYFDGLQAPVKKFYSFSHSAHSPHLEEYGLFEQLVRKDVLLLK